MKVFISWSGDRSRLIAEALKEWLPLVIQALEPWVSSQSIEKGTRGIEEIAEALESNNVGIICLTRENLVEPWILFEAGALSRAHRRVWTFLFDVTSTDVKMPLAMFQHTDAGKASVRALLASINLEVERNQERPLTEAQLDKVFAANWLALDAALTKIRKTGKPAKVRQREDRDILEEVLQLVRSLGESRSMERSGLEEPSEVLDLSNKHDGTVFIRVAGPAASRLELSNLLLAFGHAVTPAGRDGGQVVMSEVPIGLYHEVDDFVRRRRDLQLSMRATPTVGWRASGTIPPPGDSAAPAVDDVEVFDDDDFLGAIE